MGHLNKIFDMWGRGEGNLNKKIFKSSNAQGLHKGGCQSSKLIDTLHTNEPVRLLADLLTA